MRVINSLIFADNSLLWSKKFPVIFVGNFYAGQGKNTENLRTCSSLSCVRNCQKYRFFAKIPCFSLFLTVLVVCRAQVFHKPKVKDFLHRHKINTPQRGVFILWIGGADENPCSTTSRFDQCNAVKSSRLPRSRCVSIVRGNPSPSAIK